LSWLVALLWGGLVGLDATSFPQAMYSRPLVAATVTGLFFGRPLEGALIGVVLEFFALPVLPFGAAAYPESGTAAVAAAGAYFTVAGTRDDGLLLVAAVAAVLISHVAGYSVRLLRIHNARIAHGLADADGRVEPDRLEHRHRAAIALDFVRGAAVTGAAAPVVVLILVAAERLGWTAPLPPLLILATAGAVMVGSTLQVFGRARHHLVAFGVGAATGLLLLMVT